LFHAAPVRTLFRSNRELHRLRWPAMAVFGISVVLANDRNGTEHQKGTWRKSFEKCGEKIGLFTSQEGRKYPSDRAAVATGGFGESPPHGRKSLLIRSMLQRAISFHLPSNHRPHQPVVRVYVVKAKPSLVAHEVPLGTRVFAGTQPVNDVFILVDKD